MHELQAARSRLLGAAGIEFNAVSARWLALQQMRESGAVAGARIQGRERMLAIKTCAQTLGLALRQEIETKLLCARHVA
ncbi:MAG TPA: hypothetical protein VJS37_10690 [Terriglobales bacterium]|nr:hypothetical protein [Terriglobales bacterium]